MLVLIIIGIFASTKKNGTLKVWYFLDNLSILKLIFYEKYIFMNKELESSSGFPASGISLR